MIRVAISNESNNCPNCSRDDFTASYCEICQYPYYGEAEYRTDYADYTVQWCDTVKEAEEVIASLIKG